MRFSFRAVFPVKFFFRCPKNGHCRALIGLGNLKRRPLDRMTHQRPVGAPVVKRLLNSDEPVNQVGLRCHVSTSGPCLFFISQKTGSAVGVFTAHIDDILGCGTPDFLSDLEN